MEGQTEGARYVVWAQMRFGLDEPVDEFVARIWYVEEQLWDAKGEASRLNHSAISTKTKSACRDMDTILSSALGALTPLIEGKPARF